MGSSKKSSDRDKDREMESKKKKRDRSRERERSRERAKRRSRSRERGRERSKSRERRRDRSRSRERKRERSRSKDKGRERSRERGAEKGRERKKARREKERSPEVLVSKWDRSPEGSPEGTEDAGAGKRDRRRSDSDEVAPPPKREEPAEVKVSKSGDVVSMSVEETNKVRISLGLKPLQVDGGSGGGGGDDGGTANGDTQQKEEAIAPMKKDAIHAPPKNIGAIKAAEELKDKLETRRETRKRVQALSSVRTLGEADQEQRGGRGGRGGGGGDEDAKSWVEKMRRMAEEKKLAEKKAQMLAEMDEEFGVADLISEVVQEDRGRAYSAGALRGLKVEHDVSAFKEGRDTTLVIKDTGVLDESDDVLLNVNMVDAEKAAKNVELKKGKSDYNAYAEEEVDELGNVKQQNLLGKYDEEIHGEKKKSFVIGAQGSVNVEADREREIIRQRLLDQRISLETAPARVASEYYTGEEMLQFKKVKKKRKLRKVEKVKADDLLPLGPEDTSRDLGTRDRGSRRRGKEDGPVDMEIDIALPDPPVDLKDEADSSVTNALMRTRRLLKHSRGGGDSSNVGVSKVVSMLQSRETGEEQMMEGGGGGGEEGGDTIVLDTTAEFCRQIGEEDKTGVSPAPREDEDALSDDQATGTGKEQDFMDVEEEGGWQEVREHTERKKKPEATDLYQEAEPLVASGVAAALELATKKGFVTTEKAPQKQKGVIVHTSTGRRDVEYERQKEKERDRELSRYGGRESAFPEKKNYTPDVKLEYVDKDGRILNTKEAFRDMSHKFHGRTSGRKKTEKRLKKIRDQNLLNSSSSVDTPLNTLAVLQSKQKAAQSPYILVSGGAQSLQAPDIGKRK